MAELNEALAGQPGTHPGPPQRLSKSEVKRKIVHIGFGLVAFALRWLGPWWGALCAVAAVIFNFAILPRFGGKALWREGEKARGQSIGIVLYPVAVLLLILVFNQRLEVAAAMWGVLAFGDGMAGIFGMLFGRAKLPWNAKKSWIGTFAFWLFGTAAAWGLLHWTVPGRYEDWTFTLAACAAAALLAALLESMPQGLDDNIGVPLVSGLLLFAILVNGSGSGAGGWAALGEREFLVQLAIGLAVNLALAVAAYAAKAVNLSGAVAGLVVGSVIWGALGWQGFLLLAAFFVLGSAATKLGYRKKAEKKLAQEEGGRRGARHALANCGVATVCALLAATVPLGLPYALPYALAFAAAFATAAADTAGSEIGQLYGKRAYLPTTFRRVPPGTEGAVSVEGTVAGLVAGLALGALGAAVGLYPWTGAAIVGVAAFVGTTLESILGAALDTDALLDNEAMNFLNTLVGALVAFALGVAMIH